MGSSPHTRGARVADNVACGASGIIPAYAGSTSPIRTRTTGWRDHPRIRGEHTDTIVKGWGYMGSSPHTRGAQARQRGTRLVRGIIPAYAGSTPFRRRLASRGRDHPRIRGEHYTVLSIEEIGRGSSPHTRGARGKQLHVGYGPGIIPAYAGSTSDRTADRKR